MDVSRRYDKCFFQNLKIEFTISMCNGHFFLFGASKDKFALLCCCSVDSMASDQDGVPSKVSDSGVGGLESGEDSWISDTEVSQLALSLL